MTISSLEHIFFTTNPVKKMTLKPGEYVFSQGDEARNIFAVEKGQIQLERYTVEGRVVSMHTANEGESFAEAALFSEIYHCSAIALKASVIHIYPKQHILGVLRTQPEISEGYIALLSAQIRSLRSKLELRNILSARERILHYLYLAADPESAEVQLEKSHKETAADLGLAHETFYRELAKLESEKLIKRFRSKILIMKVV